MMTKKAKYPRIIVAGLSGDSGKTFLTCGILAAMREHGLRPAGFKKGPDYIDSAWIKLASGNTARNLDTYLMEPRMIKNSFFENSTGHGISIIEGNRGLYDGFDKAGTHSTAELAKLLKAPVIIIMNATKITRTAAAIILGCKELDRQVNIAGVVLNMVAGKRHREILETSITDITGIPVLGAIPKLKNKDILPSRHLGLVTPGEYEQAGLAVEEAKNAVNDYLDLEKIINIAEDAPEMELTDDIVLSKNKIEPVRVKIGYFRDRAFSFYYPENLEALERRGAKLIPVSSIESPELPEIDGLYIGGGFPESNIREIIENRSLMNSLKDAAENGLPVYAECGGLLYLGQSINIDGDEFPLAGILPLKFGMFDKPQGHGYMETIVDTENPYYKTGTVLKGHEFHYSKITWHNDSLKLCMKVKRGHGTMDKRDGIIYKNTFASYLHIHALTGSDWADGMMECALRYKQSKAL